MGANQSSPFIVLLSSFRALEEAMAEACSWANEITICAPAIDTGRNEWRPWHALMQHQRKLRRVYVALDGLRTDPSALDDLYGLGSLRLVPAADGSFHANIIRLRKGNRTCVLVGGLGLAPPGIVAPFPAVTLWEGDSRDAYALMVDDALARIADAAHVPTRDELRAYASAFYAAAEHRDAIIELGAPYMSRTSADAGLPELELLVDANEIRSAQEGLADAVRSAATTSVEQLVGFRGGNESVTVHWIAPLRIWAFTRELDTRFWNGFGTERPRPGSPLPITVEINPPIKGIERKVGGAFARDPESGDVFLLHRGRIGGGQRGVGSEMFWRRFRGGILMREPDREQPARAAVVGRIGAPQFARDVAAFVHEVRRIKAAC